MWSICKKVTVRVIEFLKEVTDGMEESSRSLHTMAFQVVSWKGLTYTLWQHKQRCQLEHFIFKTIINLSKTTLSVRFFLQ